LVCVGVLLKKKKIRVLLLRDCDFDGIGFYAVDCTAFGEYGPSDHDRTVMI
jgi:hypothetical protein